MLQMMADFRQGVRKHQAGDLVSAEAIYLAVLDESPDHPGAWHMLGLISFARKQFIQARGQIERAIALCQTKAVYFNNYGAVLPRAEGEVRGPFPPALSPATSQTPRDRPPENWLLGDRRS